MNYEVVSTSSIDEQGSSVDIVLGVVRADSEAEAGQIANERYKIDKWRFMYVRPLNERKNEKPSPMVREPDQYDFKCEGYSNATGTDQLTVQISRQLLLQTVKDILEEGLGADVDTFSVSFYGRLSLSDK